MSPVRDAPFRLGFGCASLGSRIGARKGLRALYAAHEAGINWFDLAPSYGDGEAETVFAEFAASRREALYICTKVGRAAPHPGAAARLLRPLARSLVAAAPRLRRLVALGRAPAQSRQLSRDAIIASLEASLRRLSVEQVDVFSLHDPPLDEVLRDDVQRALEDVRRSGKAARIGFAGAAPTALACAREGVILDVLQFPFDLAGHNRARVAAALGPRAGQCLIVTHSVLSAVSRVRGHEAADDPPTQRLLRLGYDLPGSAALYAAALDLALLDGNDVVLASMLRQEHLQSNLRATAGPRVSAESIRAALGVDAIPDSAT